MRKLLTFVLIFLSAYCIAQESNKKEQSLGLEIGLHFKPNNEWHYTFYDSLNNPDNMSLLGYGIKSIPKYNIGLSYNINITNFFGLKTGIFYLSSYKIYSSCLDSLQKYYSVNLNNPYHQYPPIFKEYSYSRLYIPIYLKFIYKRFSLFASLGIELLEYEKIKNKYINGAEFNSSSTEFLWSDFNTKRLFSSPLLFGLSYRVSSNYPSEIFINTSTSKTLQIGIIINLIKFK